MIQDGITAAHGQIISFLMIGQSNMAGRGDIVDVKPIDNPLCYMLRMGRWQKMSEPINPDRAIYQGTYRSGSNLCASFADAYAKYYDQKIGLIPCADGGTRIEQWMPGEILYDHAVMMAQLACRTSRLGGILWHQGESDCNEVDIACYKERFRAMVTALRKDLGAEELPFVFGELSENIAPQWKVGEYPKQMNCLFRELEKEVPNCKLVSARGLTLKPDGIHFNSQSLREFGTRYFQAYRELQKGR